MKIIDWLDQIVSLENVREVVAFTSNKNNYTIKINYTNDTFTCFRDLSLPEKNALMVDIKKILEKA